MTLLVGVKKYTLLSVSAGLMLSAGIVFAAGGGGGGGSGGILPPPPCANDTYECSDWSSCTLEGVQTRTCALTNNCPTVETAQPAESRPCTPSCTKDTWICSDWSTCSASGIQSRSCVLNFDCELTDDPKPLETQNCQPSCSVDGWSCTDFGPCQDGVQTRNCRLTFDCPGVETGRPAESQVCAAPCREDSWRCNDWSQCQADGRNRRNCQLTFDCPGVETPAPESERVCPSLRCGHLDTLAERINCRLGLSNEELTAEFQILYFPEYCKAETDQGQKACINRYQSLGHCWQLDIGPKRVSCARETIGLGEPEQEKNRCQNLEGSSRAECVQALIEKVEALVIFHLYELEVQAEELLDRGLVSQEAVAQLELFIETKKQQVESSPTVQGWKAAIWQVRERWNEFVVPLRNN